MVSRVYAGPELPAGGGVAFPTAGDGMGTNWFAKGCAMSGRSSAQIIRANSRRIESFAVAVTGSAAVVLLQCQAAR